ncbi:MAG: hypothetical protein L0Z50_38640 [Verrucomicrobiales bacterium]|nr:hypothetical protein [Verrucomicrobiales bacterium]
MRTHLTFMAAALAAFVGAGLTQATDAEKRPGTPPGMIVPIAVVKVSDSKQPYATFQSHNQKVVENAYGVFMTYLAAGDDKTSNTWRLARSTDGGASFQTIYEASALTRAPVLETDQAGSLCLIQTHWGQKNADFMRFDPARDFKHPLISKMAGPLHAWKNTSCYDPTRQRLYFATVFGFYVLDRDGKVLKAVQLWKPGPRGDSAHYPQLTMDGPMLYAAWTNHKVGEGHQPYYDIHWMASADGGETWHVPGGATLSIPVAVDDSGPAPVVSLPDEAGVPPRGPWLKNFISKGGKLHFAYSQLNLADGRQHYVRFNQTNAAKELDIHPAWQGARIKVASGDGFFATGADPTAPLYAIMHTPDNRIGILASNNLGSTWHDYA